MNLDTQIMDNDNAKDMLSDIIEERIEIIRKTFLLDCKTSLYNDLGPSMIMGNIDIIITLCKHYGTYPYSIKKIEEVIKWKENYLKNYDIVIKFYGVSDEFITQHRVVIFNTFDKLADLIRDMLN
jgi:hypothetical protein